MFIVRVAPISKGITKEELYYFSSRPYESGSIIKIELRNKETSALVLESKDALENKTEIKEADFQLKKIKKQSPKKILSEDFIWTIENFSKNNLTTTGALLDYLVPSNILSFDGIIKPQTRARRRKYLKGDILILQGEESERITHYKNIVRESFARNESVFICVPTIKKGLKIFESISRGLGDYVYFLNGSMSKKELLSNWKKATENKHSIVIIGTGQFLSIPRNDIETIILESESSNAYKSQHRPYTDIRDFIENLSEKTKARLILCDTVLRVETIWRYRERDISELYSPRFRYPSGPKTRIADMTQYKTQSEKKVFEILSNEIKHLIEKDVITNKKNMFIFVARKGLYPFTVCGDCGEHVLCERCGKPTVVQNYKSSRIFVCNGCGKTRPTEERCKHCNSWRLQALGIGSSLVLDTIKKAYPSVPISLVDKDTTKTTPQINKKIKTFYSNKGSILIGTQLALEYIENVDLCSVISIDSLFSIPDFKMNEKIFSLLVELRSKTKEKMLVQTRIKNKELIEFALRGNIFDFYKKEIEDRKKFLYPPFANFAKITIIAPRKSIEEKVVEVKKIFSGLDLELFPALHTKSGSRTAINIIIRVKKENISEFIKRTQKLPTEIIIDMNPTVLT